MGQFAQESAVQRQQQDSPQSTDEVSIFTGHISPNWNIGTNPNGGYLVATALNALAQVVPHPDPLTLTTHFLRPGQADTGCEVRTQLLRSGRTVSTARASLRQQGKSCIEVMATFGDLSRNVGVDRALSLDPPKMPDPADCTQRDGASQGLDLPIASRLDTRLHPDQALAGQNPQAQMSGWIRFADGAEPSLAALPLFADAFPPSPFALLGVVGWVPTVELTVQLRARPKPGWILGHFSCNDLHNGRMIENGRLWDSAGTLVAQSRQLGLVLAGDT